MEQQQAFELTETTYGLVTLLKDTIWSIDGINRDQQRKFSGILALIDTIEQNTYNIKVSIECL